LSKNLKLIGKIAGQTRLETGLELGAFNKNDVKIIKKECVWSNK